MTPWVLRLNDMTPQLVGRLPATDTRLRPDVRALEDGIFDQARFHTSRSHMKELRPPSVMPNMTLGLATENA